MKNRILKIILGAYLALLFLVNAMILVYPLSLSTYTSTGLLIRSLYRITNISQLLLGDMSILSNLLSNIIVSVFLLYSIDYFITKYHPKQSQSRFASAQAQPVNMGLGRKIIIAIFLLLPQFLHGYAILFGLSYGLLEEVGVFAVLILVMPLILSVVGLGAWLIFRRSWGLVIAIIGTAAGLLMRSSSTLWGG